MIKAAREVRLPFLPGVATPSEIEAMLEEGHLWQKIPGELGNFEALLGWIEAAYRHTGLRLVPAGGIALEELPRFLQKPIVGAVAGDWVTPVALLQEQRWDKIRALARRLVSLLGRGDALTDTTKRCVAEGVVGAQQTI